MKAKLEVDMGGSYTLTDGMLAKGHKCHDLDGNGQVTKDEIIWARKLKSRYYRSKRLLTKEIGECFHEDLDLFLALPPDVQNNMIVAKAYKKKRDAKSIQKGVFAVHKIFLEADANNDG